MRFSIIFKKTIILISVFLLGSLFITGDMLAYDFTDWYHGASGYEDALDEVIGEEKPLILYFHKESCKWCKKLDSEYLVSDNVDEFISNIPKVEINSAKEAPEKALYDKYGVTGVPAFFVLMPSMDSKPAKSMSPFLKGKHQTTDEFVDAIKRRITYKYNNKGYSLFNDKQYEEALKYYEMSLNFDSRNVYAYYAMGLAYHTIGHNQKDPDLFEKSEENYSKALEIDPNHEESIKGLENLRQNKSQ
jgi:tetratricopeptide (TPR) repeat protein